MNKLLYSIHGIRKGKRVNLYIKLTRIGVTWLYIRAICVLIYRTLFQIKSKNTANLINNVSKRGTK